MRIILLTTLAISGFRNPVPQDSIIDIEDGYARDLITMKYAEETDEPVNYGVPRVQHPVPAGDPTGRESKNEGNAPENKDAASVVTSNKAPGKGK